MLFRIDWWHSSGSFHSLPVFRGTPVAGVTFPADGLGVLLWLEIPFPSQGSGGLPCPPCLVVKDIK